MALDLSKIGTIPQGQSYDAAYDNSVNNIREKLASLHASRDLSKQRLDQDLEKGKEDLNKSHTETLSALQERLANRGTLRSGVNIGEQGRIATEVQEKRGAMQTQHTRSLENLERETASQQQGYNTELQELNLQRTRREEERAERAAAEEAERKANEELANHFRAQLDEMKERLLKATQPQPTPTGQFQLPPPPPPPAPPAPPPPMNLGQPPVARPQAAPPPNVKDNASLKDLQRMLAEKGFDPGPQDGMWGPRTKQALEGWKRAAGMPVNDIVDAGIMTTLQFWAGKPGGVTMTGPSGRPPGASMYGSTASKPPNTLAGIIAANTPRR
jgi:hypothetical protein